MNSGIVRTALTNELPRTEYREPSCVRADARSRQWAVNSEEYFQRIQVLIANDFKRLMSEIDDRSSFHDARRDPTRRIRARTKALEALGTLPQRARVGNGREDYSAYGTAWEYFPHDHARSRAYRWGEDGLAGICDRHQMICFALALWNERDPILKERLFGLTGNEGNHGEDVKEYYFYLDTHADAFLHEVSLQVSAGRVSLRAAGRRKSAARQATIRNSNLLDTGIFDEDRYFDVFVEYAKADVRRHSDPDHGDQSRARSRPTLHLLPTIWFRNTWSWGDGTRDSPC